MAWLVDSRPNLHLKVSLLLSEILTLTFWTKIYGKVPNTRYLRIRKRPVFLTFSPKTRQYLSLSLFFSPCLPRQDKACLFVIVFLTLSPKTTGDGISGKGWALWSGKIVEATYLVWG